MNIIIVDNNKLRTACKAAATRKGYKSMTEMFKKIGGANTSEFAKTSLRFNNAYKDRVHFPVEKYVEYGAFFEDTWNAVVKIADLNADDFILETIENVSYGNRNTYQIDVLQDKLEALETKVATLEATITETTKKLAECERHMNVLRRYTTSNRNN